MTDLSAWLLEQIAEDEAVVQRNSGEHGIGPGMGWPDYQTYDGEDIDAANDFIQQFSSNRMHAECDANRRIVKLHHHEKMDYSAIARVTGVPAEEVPYLACVVCGRRDEDGDLRFDSNKQWCQTLRLRALPYADRPGYRDEWSPDGR